MKKRILSMLLLVAMIVTALPLMVLPSLAAEEKEKEYEEKDYNALYVQDGLAMAADFFRMNKYWNTNGTDYTVPLGSSEYTDFEYNGVKYDFTGDEVQAKLAAGDAETKAAFTAATTQWQDAYVAYINSFVWTNTASNSMKFSVYKSTSTTTKQEKAPFVSTAEGYMQFRAGHNTSGGLVFVNAPTTGVTEATGQLLIEYAPNSSTYGAVPNIFYDIRITLSKAAANNYYTIGKNSGGKLPITPPKNDFKLTVETPVTLTQKFTLVSGTGVDTYTVGTQNGEIFTVTGDYGTGATAIYGSTYIGWSSSYDNLRLYGYRSYTRKLSDTEVAQNHFADIAKYFRLDLAPLALLDSTDMGAVYTSVKDMTFKSDRNAVVAAYLAALTTILEGKYEGVPSAYAAIAAKHGIDLSILLQLPQSFLPNTYAFLNSVNDASTNVKAGFTAAVSADVAAILSKATLSYTDYDALYVQENLTTAIDYFATNEYWGQAALGATSETYIRKWSYNNSTTGARILSLTDKSGTVANGYLHLTGNVLLGETNKANNYSHNGMTTEFVFRDSKVSGGTFLNIDDFRFATKAVGGDYNLYAFGQRSHYAEQYLRLPEADATGSTYATYLPQLTIPYENVARTYVMQAYTPEHTQYYYNYSYKDVVEAYKAEGKEFVVPADTYDEETKAYTGQLQRVETETVNGVKTKVVKSWGTSAATLLGGGHTYFYVTHDANGNLLTDTDANGNTVLVSERHQFAFQKPTYTEIDGKVYITGATSRATNFGIGYGEFGNDYYHKELGSIAFSIDGETLFANDGVIWPNNSGIMGGTFLLYDLTGVERDVFAYRSYDRILSDAELAQNHFVDVVKYYKLNIADLSLLDEKGKAAVYAAVQDVRLAEVDRTTAQIAVSAAIHSVLVADYESMKGEDIKVNAFIDFAAEYHLDIKDILNSDRAVPSVFEASFVGTRAEMQADVDEAFRDAYYFLSYQVKGEAAWNEWLAAVAAADAVANLETLMTLPFAERVGIVSVAADDVDAIEAYTADAIAKYNVSLPTYDYNSLYLKDGLILAFDIMQTNSYWGEAITDYPTLPTELTAYEFDTNGDGKIDPETEIYDFTKFDQRYDLGKYIIKQIRVTNSSGAEYITGHTTSIKIPGTGNYRGSTVPSFDSVADAEAYIKTLPTADDKGTYSYRYEVMKPYLVCYRDKDATTGVYAQNQVLTDVSFDSVAAAEAAYPDTATRDYYVVPAAPSHAFYTAVDKFYADEAAWLRKYTWSITELSGSVKISSGNPLSSGNAFSQARDAVLLYACYETPVEGLGYLIQRYPHTTDNGILISGFADAHKKADNVAAQIVTRIGTRFSNAEFHLFYNARPTYNRYGDTFKFTGVKTGFVSSGTAITSEHVSMTDVISMTISMNGVTTKNEAGTTDTYKVRLPGETVYETKGLYAGGAAKDLDATNQIGYSNSMGGAEIYAIRYYSRDLSDAEILQNNFADLAKWYRLELNGFEDLTDEKKTALYEAFAGYTVNDGTDRAELVALYYNVLTDNYTAGEGVLSADMLALARKLGLDITGLLDATPAVCAYIESMIFADFALNKAMSREVTQFLINEALVYKAAFAYEGIQVRLQSKASIADMPGVRAIFTANKGVLDAYAEISKDLAFGVEICDVSGKTLAILRFAPDGDAGYSGTNTLASGASAGKAIITPVGENSLAFAYTVIFDTAQTQTADYYNVEFGYRFFFEVNGLRHNVNTLNSDTFGDTVSAAEAYDYFYKNGFADDSVVAGVVNTLNGGATDEDAILVTTPEEAQAALDNAEAGATIQLAPGVDYGVLYLRPVAGGAPTKLVDWIGNNYHYETYTLYENVTIKGAPGATVDAIEIEGGTYYYSEHSQSDLYPVMLSLVELKNVVIDGVTFTGKGGYDPQGYGNAINLSGCNIKVDGLTLKDCVLENADNNARLLYKTEATTQLHTYAYEGETYSFMPTMKDITVTGCTFNGGYMGIELRETENLTITNNVFAVANRNILLPANDGCTYSGTVTITGNVSNNAKERFVRADGMGDAVVIITGNVLNNYLGADADFIKVTNSNNVTIENNTKNP